MSEDNVEQIGPLVVHQAPQWQEEVWSRADGKCCNCGSKHKVALKLIVAEEAGGKQSADNAYLICRSCEIAASAAKPKNKHSDNRPINFWVSRRLFESMNEALASKTGFKGKSALIRDLMTKYITSESQYDDLEQYQDMQSTDQVKINAWVPRSTYETFKVLLNKRGLTVTEAIVSLIMVFEEEIKE